MRTLFEEHLEVAEGASNELVKMVRKLRWIGMEEDAKRLQDALSCLPSNARASVVAGPHSTD